MKDALIYETLYPFIYSKVANTIPRVYLTSKFGIDDYYVGISAADRKRYDFRL